MIPAIPRAVALLACTCDAELLRAVGQGAVPLHVVYLESRRPICLPRRVVIGAWLRPLVCMPFLDGVSVRVVGEPPPQMMQINTGREHPGLEFWPPRPQGAA
ncbi:hypothetical protein [Deinococcus marmoris]|uniref:Uncharacterized protein n=1 Tax=Deinococcus marmoris TaxID=249408 RepID=A0A1U7P4V7_9DEIO|nr:hypothetical protein [Deinococcus marmoris]OLV20203.1 hypothetical protein BOO71_0000637 [Deinococcus marmoris]